MRRVFVAAFVAVAAVAGGTGYVLTGDAAETGVDCNRVVSPGESIQSQLNQVVPGDDVCVHAGEYTGELVASRSGTQSLPITLQGYPGESKPIIRPVMGLPGSHNTLKIYTASWFNVRGLVLEGSYSDQTGCNAFNIWVSQGGAAHDDEITDNESRDGTAGSGILTENTTARLKILRNSFHGNVDTVNCQGAQVHGMYIQGTGHTVANNLVFGNVDPDGGFGIQAYPSGSGSVFAQNTITGAPLSCFYLTYKATIANNICVGNGGFVGGGGATGCQIVKNLRWQSGANRPSRCLFSGDVNADPLFENGYHLGSGSPAVDVAEPKYSYSPDYDFVTRPQGPVSDLGAYERVSP